MAIVRDLSGNSPIDYGVENSKPCHDGPIVHKVSTPVNHASTVVAPGRRFAVTCSSAGTVVAVLQDGSKETLTVPTGYSVFEMAVVRVDPASTATATYSNLD